MADVDLERERRESVRRRKAQQMDRRARRILDAAGWSADFAALAAAAAEAWPDLVASRAEIVARAQELQEDEAEGPATRRVAREVYETETQTEEAAVPKTKKGYQWLPEADRKVVHAAAAEHAGARINEREFADLLGREHGIEIRPQAAGYYLRKARNGRNPAPATKAAEPAAEPAAEEKAERSAPAPAPVQIELHAEGGEVSTPRGRIEWAEGALAFRILEDGRWRIEAGMAVPAELGDRIAGAIYEHVMGAAELRRPQPQPPTSEA